MFGHRRYGSPKGDLNVRTPKVQKSEGRPKCSDTEGTGSPKGDGTTTVWSPRIPGRRNHVNVESENTWEAEPRQCGVREYLGDGTTSMWSLRIPGRRNHVNVESENTWGTEPRQCGVREYLGDGTTSMRSPRIPALIVSVLLGNNIQTVWTESDTVSVYGPRVTRTDRVRNGEGEGGFNCFD